MAFRLFKHTWLGTDYPNHNANDVKDCLEKLINPMLINDCGWSWDTTHCPDSEPILLTPTDSTYAAFIKHTSGSKAMIGYSLFGQRVGNTVKNNNGDVCFLSSHIWDRGETYEKMLGLFFSFITADSVNIDGADFHPEYSILDENFYDASMSLIFSLCWCVGSASSTSSYNRNMIYNVADSNQCTHFLMADTENPILYLGSKYALNNTNQAIFGEIATGQRRYSYDIKNTAKFVAIMGGGSESFSTSSSALAGEQTVIPYTVSNTTTYNKGVNGTCFFSTGTGFTWTMPRVNSYNWVSSTPRTASLICDSCRVYNENLRAIWYTGISFGQVYDKGNWCCISQPTDTTYYNGSLKINNGPSTNSGTNGSYFSHLLIVKWDSEFNQGNRLE